MIDGNFRLWQTASIEVTFSRRHEFELPDSAKFFFDKLTEQRVLDNKKKYLPNARDVMYARIQANGVARFDFHQVKTTIHLNLVDFCPAGGGLFDWAAQGQIEKPVKRRWEWKWLKGLEVNGFFKIVMLNFHFS